MIRLRLPATSMKTITKRGWIIVITAITPLPPVGATKKSLSLRSHKSTNPVNARMIRLLRNVALATGSYLFGLTDDPKSEPSQ